MEETTALFRFSSVQDFKQFVSGNLRSDDGMGSLAIDNTSGTFDPLPADLAMDLVGQLCRHRSDPFGNGMLMIILLLEPFLVHSSGHIQSALAGLGYS